MERNDERKSSEVLDLNIDDLDIEQLEQRLELAATHLEEAWDECPTCFVYNACANYDGFCGYLFDCGLYTNSCKPVE